VRLDGKRHYKQHAGQGICIIMVTVWEHTIIYAHPSKYLPQYTTKSLLYATTTAVPFHWYTTYIYRNYAKGGHVQQAKPWNYRTVYALIYAIFVFFGVAIGANGVLWAEILPALQMGEALFGTLTLISPFISVFILLFAGQFIERVGKHHSMTFGILMLVLASVSLAMSQTPFHFGLVSALYGIGYGAVELSVNSVTMDWERERNTTVMNKVHAAFCVGAVFSSLITGQLLGMGLTYQMILIIIAVIGTVIMLINQFVPYPPSHIEEGAAGAGAAIRLLIHNPIVLTLSMIGFFAAFGEGLAINWSVLHLRDLGASAFVGGAGFAIFNTVMFIGRMTNNAVVARFGVVQSVVFSAIAITIAGVVIAFTSNLWLAVIALGVLGFGVAGPIPTTLTAGAQLVPGQNSALSGALMSMCYVSFIVGPPLIGIVAERTTLQQALIATIVVGICLFVFARRLATITQRATISPPNA